MQMGMQEPGEMYRRGYKVSDPVSGMCWARWLGCVHSQPMSLFPA